MNAKNLQGETNLFSRIRELFTDPLRLLYVLPAILIGLTVHEWAHAFAAYKMGDPTAKNLGRMTLNPLAHIDPFGFLMLIVVGFGWARPVPVNPRNFKNFRRDDIIVSLAGIAANCVVAFLATLIFYFGAYKWNLLGNAAFTGIMTGVIGINLSLMLFNLLPIHPLDGSHVAESLFYRRAPRFFNFLRQYGQWILIGLLITNLLSSVLSAAVNGIFSAFSSAALFLVGLF